MGKTTFIILGVLAALAAISTPVVIQQFAPAGPSITYITPDMSASSITNVMAQGGSAKVYPGNYHFPQWTTPVNRTNIDFESSTFWIGAGSVPLITDTNGAKDMIISGNGRFYYTNGDQQLLLLTNRNTRAYIEFYRSDGGMVKVNGGTNIVLKFDTILITNADTALDVNDAHGLQCRIYVSGDIAAAGHVARTLQISGTADPTSVLLEGGKVYIDRSKTGGGPVRYPTQILGRCIIRNVFFDHDLDHLGYGFSSAGVTLFDSCTFQVLSNSTDAIIQVDDLNTDANSRLHFKNCRFISKSLQWPPIENNSLIDKTFIIWEDCYFDTIDPDEGAVTQNSRIHLAGQSRATFIHRTVKFENNFHLICPPVTNIFTDPGGAPGGTNIIINTAGSPIQVAIVTNSFLCLWTNATFWSGNEGTIALINNKLTNMPMSHTGANARFMGGVSNVVEAGRTTLVAWKTTETNLFLSFARQTN